jgi:hypothetical protein
MPRIGIISDTHGNFDLMRSAAYALRDAHDTTRIIHLGDYYRDGIALRSDGFTLWLVPGTACPAYGTSERILREAIGGVQVVAAHTPDDLAAAANGAGLALHGHTHAPYVEQRGHTVWLNPGHLKAPLDRGHRPSYAVVDLESGLIQATIHGVDGSVVTTGAFRLPQETAHA